MSETPLVAALRDQERAWEARPLVRSLYEEWFEELTASLSRVPGPSIELGAGIGRYHHANPAVVPTDVEPTPWSDEVADAESLTFGDGELANLVLVDVFHHIAAPARFLDEAVRTLRPGGHVVILDPYCSPVSTRLYRRFHHEHTDLRARPFDEDERVREASLASNQARATLAFFRNLDELAARWPELAIVKRRRLALFVYPLSGGFTGRQLLPYRLGRMLRRIEVAFGWTAPLLAFRCLVVLERRQ